MRPSHESPRSLSDAGAPQARLARQALPTAQSLAALGTVLCVYRSRPGDGLGGELGGWQQAVHAEAWCGIDSDGWQECLQFRDRDGDCCWRLYLLPDSDFLAWDRLQQRLPRVETPHASCRDCRSPQCENVAGRLWRRLSRRLSGERWQVSALRLHALPVTRADATQADATHGLAASLATLSAQGLEMRARIARSEQIDTGSSGEVDAMPWRPGAMH